MLADDISVSIAAPPKAALLGGPVAAILTVRNTSARTVKVSLLYPNPNNLKFVGKSPDLATAKPVELDEFERVAPTVLEPGKSITAEFYLNRYLRFQKPGKVEVEYQLRLPLEADGLPEDAKYRGTFAVQVVEASDDQLRTELGVHAMKLHGQDRQAKQEAAEALAYLENPIAGDYMAEMLKVENVEIIGIHALGRLGVPKFTERIADALGHKESGVVAAALEELSKPGRSVARERVQKLLGSDNANTRLTALRWLADRPAPADRPVVTPLLEDPNAVVREKAGAYLQTLGR